MVSKFSLPVDLTKPTNAHTLEKYKTTRFEWRKKFPMFVPKFMSSQTNDKPKTTIYHLTSSIFVNRNTRPKVTSMTLREQNYITTEYNDGLVETGRISVIETVNGVSTSYVPKGANLRFSFLNGKLSRPVMETASIDQKFIPVESNRDSSGGTGYINPPISTNAIILTNNTGRTSLPGLARGGAIIELVNGELLFNGYNIPEN